jgi:hypothetical protein
VRVPTVSADLCRRTTTQQKITRPYSEIGTTKFNAMWTPSILTFFGFGISALKPHHFVLASNSGHRVNAAPPSVRCVVKTQHRPSFLRPEESMTSRRPLKRQDALGKRIAISILVSTPWTSMIPVRTFSELYEEEVLPHNIFVDSQWDEAPLVQLFIVMFRYLRLYQHPFLLGGG